MILLEALQHCPILCNLTALSVDINLDQTLFSVSIDQQRSQVYQLVNLKYLLLEAMYISTSLKVSVAAHTCKQVFDQELLKI